jgi:hypothetical protein
MITFYSEDKSHIGDGGSVCYIWLVDLGTMLLTPALPITNSEL